MHWYVSSGHKDDHKLMLKALALETLELIGNESALWLEKLKQQATKLSWTMWLVDSDLE